VRTKNEDRNEKAGKLGKEKIDAKEKGRHWEANGKGIEKGHIK
jgi:hypothetical protein